MDTIQKLARGFKRQGKLNESLQCRVRVEEDGQSVRSKEQFVGGSGSRKDAGSRSEAQRERRATGRRGGRGREERRGEERREGNNARRIERKRECSRRSVCDSVTERKQNSAWTSTFDFVHFQARRNRQKDQERARQGSEPMTESMFRNSPLPLLNALCTVLS